MGKLFLFDIDSTLVTSNTHADRFETAIKNLHGLEVSLTDSYHGLTDQLILAAMLQDYGWTTEQIDKSMPELVKELDVVHAKTFEKSSMILLPGVEALLEELSDRGHILGLITGNTQTIAERKLEAVGIWHFFSLGGFGNDPHIRRADLVTTAIKRAGYNDKLTDVFVVGDTARDIEAAHDAGIKNSVGVANGFRDIEELAEARFVFESFEVTQKVLKVLSV